VTTRGVLVGLVAALALAAASAGCRSTARCREGTLLLTVLMGAGTEQATHLRLLVTRSNGQRDSSGEVRRPAGQSRGTIEIALAQPYVASQSVTVNLIASRDETLLAAWSQQVILEPGCSTATINLVAMGNRDAGTDGSVDARDALPPDAPAADGPPDAPPGVDGPADDADPQAPDGSEPPDAPTPDPDAPPDTQPDGSDPDTGGSSPTKIVFVTSSRHTGNLGGLAGAHAICQQRAGEASLTGTFRAWLSLNLSSGPASYMVHSSVPYVLPGGERVADSWIDLTDGELSRPIEQDEHGRRIDPEPFGCDGGEVWSNTTTVGNAVLLGPDCAGWTGTSGRGGAGNLKRKDARWTDNCTATCLTDLPLYCFQQ
jgi:hypothetical protein